MIIVETTQERKIQEEKVHDNSLVSKRLVAFEETANLKNVNKTYYIIIAGLFFAASIYIWWGRIIVAVPVIGFLGFLILRNKKRIDYLDDRYMTK